MQRRIVNFRAQICQGIVELMRSVSGVLAAVNIALQHLQTQPATLTLRDLPRHLLSQLFGFTQQRLRVVHQFKRRILLVAVDGHF